VNVSNVIFQLIDRKALFYLQENTDLFIFIWGKKYGVCLSVHLISCTPHADTSVKHQVNADTSVKHQVFWASFLTLLADFMQELRLCSLATAAIPTFHSSAQNGVLVHDILRQTTGEEPC